MRGPSITIRHRERTDDEARCPEAWWTTAPREGFTRLAQQHEPRIRARGIGYYGEVPQASMGRRGMGQ